PPFVLYSYVDPVYLHSFPTRRSSDLVVSAAIAIFSVFLFIYGIQFAGLGMDFYAPTLGVTMIYVYTAIPVLALLLFIYSIVYIIDRYYGIEQRNEVDDI